MSEITNIRQDTTNVYAQQTNGGDLGEDAFLRLLVTQLQNQDPVNPMNSSEFASQLAQFNSVEQMTQVNDNLEQMMLQDEIIGSGLSNTLAASLPGKTVKAISNGVVLGESGETNIDYTLANSADEITISIINEAGTVVRTETISGRVGGEYTYEWDGKSDSGSSMPQGNYVVQMSATSGEDAVPITTFFTGTVDKVKYTPEGVQLEVNGVFVGLGDVEEIGI